MNFVSLDNPWDLKKVRAGETDQKTGGEKKQKPMWITVLAGSRYAFTHIFQICYSSLSTRGYYVKLKDVDALQTKMVLGLMGTATEWDPVSNQARLYAAAECHEEWMQANLTHGFTLKEYMGEPLPKFRRGECGQNR